MRCLALPGGVEVITGSARVARAVSVGDEEDCECEGRRKDEGDGC